VRTSRLGLKVAQTQSAILQQHSVHIPCHEPDRFGHTTEVCAIENRRDTQVGSSAVIKHAGKAIDDDLGIVDPCHCRAAIPIARADTTANEIFLMIRSILERRKCPTMERYLSFCRATAAARLAFRYGTPSRHGRVVWRAAAPPPCSRALRLRRARSRPKAPAPPRSRAGSGGDHRSLEPRPSRD